jgi:hypothetical protein
VYSRPRGYARARQAIHWQQKITSNCFKERQRKKLRLILNARLEKSEHKPVAQAAVVGNGIVLNKMAIRTTITTIGIKKDHLAKRVVFGIGS